MCVGHHLDLVINWGAVLLFFEILTFSVELASTVLLFFEILSFSVELASTTENVKISKKGVQRPSYWV